MRRSGNHADGEQSNYDQGQKPGAIARALTGKARFKHVRTRSHTSQQRECKQGFETHVSLLYFLAPAVGRASRKTRLARAFCVLLLFPRDMRIRTKKAGG